MNHQLTIEVCVDSLESAIAAERGGAQRVELCSGLPLGGVTPSAGLLATARKKISVGLHVMIRPREGDFYYTADEFSVMQRDVLMAKQLGADGVVLGLLDENGNVDVPRARQLIDLARPLKTTFHRAFDMSANLQNSLEQVLETGADMILTSGGAPTALVGAAVLKNLMDAAGGRINIMACGGINAQNVRAVIEKTGANEIHVGLRTSVVSQMSYKNENISLGTLKSSDYQRFVVLKENVQQLVEACKTYSANH